MVLNQKLSTREDGRQINHYWMMKNMMCNLAEDMLSNWSKAWVAIHTMKSKISQIEAQITAMDNSFAWKGTAGISSLNGRKAVGRA